MAFTDSNNEKLVVVVVVVYCLRRLKWCPFTEWHENTNWSAKFSNKTVMFTSWIQLDIVFNSAPSIHCVFVFIWVPRVYWS